MGKGSKSVQAPQMSAEEKALLRKQGAAADKGLELLNEQEGLADVLLPTLFQEAGLDPIYRSEESINEELAGLESQLGTLRRAQFSDIPDARSNPSPVAPFFGGGFNQPRQQTTRRVENTDVTRQIADIQRQISDLRRTGPSEITGFNRRVDPDQAKRDEIERGFLDRTAAALRGDLNVNPALLRDLREEEEKLESTLRSRLGSGFETSTAGIQALDRFRETKFEALENARRADLNQAASGAISFGGFNESLTDTFLQRVSNAGQFKNPLFGATAQVGNSFASPAAAFARQRELQTNVALQNAQNSGSGFLGSVVGGLAGAALNPIGTAAGNSFMSIFSPAAVG